MIGDGEYPSLLQGVSQQVLQHRKEGQIAGQVNMLSDAVTGLRRRVGARYVNKLEGTFDTLKIKSFFVEYEGMGYNIIINSATGSVYWFTESWTYLNVATNTYLIAPSASDIRLTNVGGYSYLANVTKKPTKGTSGAGKRNPIRDGWIRVLAGAFSKAYTVTIAGDGVSGAFTYTTPDGSSAAHVQLATAEGIATALYNLIIANATLMTKFDVYKEGGVIFVTTANKTTNNIPVDVTTSSGDIYMMTSKLQSVRLIQDLPANLPVEASNTVVSVGASLKARSYFKWNDVQSLWDECSSYDSFDTILTMPLRFDIVTDVLSLTQPTYAGRTAGDAESSPETVILTSGITGIGAYQGRLVILSGGFVCLSASSAPTIFMRTTAVDVIGSDPIEISAGSVSSASFEYATAFNKDLFLSSNTHQAVIPAGNTGITSGNAMVVLSSNTAIDTNEYFGVGEFFPSADSEAQYLPANLTDHLPRYIQGSCRAIVGSSNSSVAVFLGDTNPNEILIHEYIWDGDQRVQNAWHKWVLPYPVASAHFVRGIVALVLRTPSRLLMVNLDIRAASYQQSDNTVAFLDVYKTYTVVNNTVTVDVMHRDVTLAGSLYAAQASGTLIGEPVGIESFDTTTGLLTTVRSFKNGTITVGWRFTSSFTPSPPLIRNKDGQPIIAANTNVLKYIINVRNSGDFLVELNAQHTEGVLLEGSGLLWSSEQLNVNKRQIAGYGKFNVPVRAISDRSECTIYTSDTRELNVLTIEYTLRGVQKRTRL
jgi:hypothetical protein